MDQQSHFRETGYCPHVLLSVTIGELTDKGFLGSFSDFQVILTIKWPLKEWLELRTQAPKPVKTYRMGRLAI